MAKCKDCIHAEVCEEYGEVFSLIKGGKCSLFKDRSQFVELPCKAGDILELFEEFFELGADALDRLCQENNWADYPDEEVDKQNYRYRELGQIFLENLQEKYGF